MKKPGKGGGKAKKSEEKRRKEKKRDEKKKRRSDLELGQGVEVSLEEEHLALRLHIPHNRMDVIASQELFPEEHKHNLTATKGKEKKRDQRGQETPKREEEEDLEKRQEGQVGVVGPEVEDQVEEPHGHLQRSRVGVNPRQRDLAHVLCGRPELKGHRDVNLIIGKGKREEKGR